MKIKPKEANHLFCVHDLNEYCRATECMAWRYYKRLTSTGAIITLKTGYCGLVTENPAMVFKQPQPKA